MNLFLPISKNLAEAQPSKYECYLSNAVKNLDGKKALDRVDNAK
jgi:hypothetical protein